MTLTIERLRLTIEEAVRDGLEDSGMFSPDVMVVQTVADNVIEAITAAEEGPDA